MRSIQNLRPLTRSRVRPGPPPERKTNPALTGGVFCSCVAFVGDPLARLAPALCFVLEQKTVDDADDGVLFFGRELGDGLEMQSQRVVRPAFVFVEQQFVGGDGERLGQPDEGIDGGLGATALVALDLLNMNPGGLGERGLGVVLGFAYCNQTLGKAHVEGGQQ